MSTYRELRNELRIGWDSGDRWGSTMGLFFDACDELYRRGEDIPDAWGFRASPLGVGEPDTLEGEILLDALSDDILRLGNVLDRYRGMLIAQGEDY